MFVRFTINRDTPLDKHGIFNQDMANNTVSVYIMLRDHNWMLLAHRLLVYCSLEFKLSYLKNLKLFSIRVKELSEPIVL